MATSKNPKTPVKSRNKLSSSNLTYYLVVSLAILIGLTSYNAGASIEGVLIRVLVTLLACTVLGYVINLALVLSAATLADKAIPATAAARTPRPEHVGSKIDLVADEDLSEQLQTRLSPQG